MLFMVPSIKVLYDDFDADLPAATMIVVNISNFFVSFWWALAIVAVAAVIGAIYYRSTPTGREVFDRGLLLMPIFGKLIQKSHVAEFARLLSMLLQSGLPIISALQIVSNALSNVHFKKAIVAAAREVEKGVPLAVPISKSEEFPMIVSRIIATGENTGNLDKVLADIAGFYQAEVDEMTNNLTKLMEPIILVVVGGLIAFLAIVVYAPIYQLADVIG
jgi:type IV pilus assembly protein PilC